MACIILKRTSCGMFGGHAIPIELGKTLELFFAYSLCFGYAWRLKPLSNCQEIVSCVSTLKLLLTTPKHYSLAELFGQQF